MGSFVRGHLFWTCYSHNGNECHMMGVLVGRWVSHGHCGGICILVGRYIAWDSHNGNVRTRDTQMGILRWVS